MYQTNANKEVHVHNLDGGHEQVSITMKLYIMLYYDLRF